jgi:hypothetical protein
MSSHMSRKSNRHDIAMPLAVSIIAASLLAQTVSAFAQTPQVKFTATVPAPPAQMQVYKLATTPAPVEFLNEKLAARKLPALQVESDKLVARMAPTPDAVRAYVDTTTNDAHLIPNLSELTTAIKPVAASGLTAARAALTDVRFIPKDVTQLRFADPITVTGAANVHATPGANTTLAVKAVAPATILTINPAVRYAGGFRVYGLGSHASVSTANDGTVVGALRRWRTASLGDVIKPTITADQVRAEIQRQLGPTLSAQGTTANVTTIELAYIDNNENFMQPVYHFIAQVTPGNKQVAGIAVSGFVAIGKLYEPIPDLTSKPVNGPATPKQIISPVAGPAIRTEAETAEAIRPELATGAVAATAATNGGIGNTATPVTLGEYANQDWPNNNAYVTMSNSFYNGLEAGNNQVASKEPKIVRTQWYVAYPWEVVGPSSKSFMNAVNIAYTVPHGDWLLNTTLSNYGDLWYVTQIGTGGNPGYGAAAGGKLATWVIMSCEVVPSMYDRQNEVNATDNPQTAFNAWWPVFQGLHNVIGFRTQMLYPDDNLNYAFGKDAALGGDINAAWFQEVAANDPNDGTYHDGHLKGNPLVHYDRASTIIDARDLGKSIYDVTPQTASTTLWNFWMNN